MRFAEYCQYNEYLKMSVEELEEEISKRPIKRWAYLIHDKDNQPDGTPKDPHIHIMMELNGDTAVENIAKWFKDEPQYIERAKSKKYPYENMCSYLIHETPCKDGSYHYDPEDVKANFDFVAFIEQIRAEVTEAENKPRINRDPLKPVLEKIANNEIPRIKVHEAIDDYTYVRRKRDIENAYNVRDEKIAGEGISRSMKTIYITGKAGSGKTTLAKHYAAESGYSVFITGSSNDPLQGYIGQECIIFDDIRGSDWKINDLLKILDPHTNSLAKSRYSNKMLNDCKMMILTSVQTIDELYAGLKESGNKEPIEQLKRRCQTMITLDRNEMYVAVYDPQTGNYKKQATLPNIVSMMNYVIDNSDVLEGLERMTKRFREEHESRMALAGNSNTSPPKASQNALNYLTEGRPKDEITE